MAVTGVNWFYLNVYIMSTWLKCTKINIHANTFSVKCIDLIFLIFCTESFDIVCFSLAGIELNRVVPGNQTTLDITELQEGDSYSVSVIALVGSNEGDPVTVYIKAGVCISLVVYLFWIYRFLKLEWVNRINNHCINIVLYSTLVLCICESALDWIGLGSWVA